MLAIACAYKRSANIAEMKNRAVMEVEISQHETIPGKYIGVKGVIERYHIEHASGLLTLLIDRKCNFHKDKRFTRDDFSYKKDRACSSNDTKAKMSRQERAKGLSQKRKGRK